MKQLQHTNFDPKSVFWMLAWAAAFSTTMSLVKLLSADISIFMIVLLRTMFGFMFFVPFILREGIGIAKTQRLPLHFVRVLLLCGAMFCTYYAYSHLPIALATSIGFTAPLMTAMLSIVLLRERVEWYKWLLIIVGYCGVLVMVRPGSIEFGLSVFIALMANFFASNTMIVVRKLSSTESTATIMFYSQVLGLTIWAILGTLFWQTPSLNDILLLSGIGAFGVFSQFCYTHSLKMNSPVMMAPFEYTRLIFAIPVGVMLFGEVPTILTFIGSSIIIFSNFLLLLSNNKKLAIANK